VSLPGEWLRRLHYLLQRTRRDASLRQEIESHRAMMAADGRAARFGNPVLAREDAHAVWGWTRLDDVLRDVRYAARTLLRTPGFTIVAVLSLALATGATTAIFSIVNAVLLRPLPFAAPDRLVQVREIHRIGSLGAVAFADLTAFRAESRSFERFAGYERTVRLVEGQGGLERLTTVVADRHLFDMLGVQPVAGRTFTAGDPDSVAVISAGLWDRSFERSPSAIGRIVGVSGNQWDPVQKRSVVVRRELTIIGVMPERFQFPYGSSSTMPGALPETRTDLWIPDSRPNGGRFANVTGRLGPGVTIEAAQAELNAIESRLDVTQPGPNRALGVQLTSLGDEVLGPVRPSLWLLFGAVALVLAAACANVANLLLARTTGRIPEIATRAALGAGPARLGRQFLAESLLLSFAGGAAGVMLAKWTLDLLVALAAERIPRAHEIALDWRTFAFLLIVCAAAALAFGLVPGLIAARTDAQQAIKASGRSTESSRLSRLRDGLVVLEVALAFVLAFGVAGVMRELSRLERVDSGMQTDGVITLHLTPRIPDRDYYAMEQRVAGLPGVRAAGFIQLLPLQHWGWIGDYHINGRPETERPKVEQRTITPGYFATLGIPLRGRALTPLDPTADPAAVLVNQTLARLHFGNEDPIGRHTDRGVIVGVVGDVRQSGLNREPVPEMYQTVGGPAGIAADIGFTLLVRTDAAPEAIVPAIRAAVLQTNPGVAIFNVRTMAQVVKDSLWELRLYRWLVGMFALLALALAAIGLYGVISYGVHARIREYAVRLALGSDPAGLARLVLARGLRLAVSGLGLGAVAALALLPLLRRVPANITPDVATFAAIAAALIAIALTACVVPALRVAAVNPASALRRE
jgi:putative ABC transport system permease protein